MQDSIEDSNDVLNIGDKETGTNVEQSQTGEKDHSAFLEQNIRVKIFYKRYVISQTFTMGEAKDKVQTPEKDFFQLIKDVVKVWWRKNLIDAIMLRDGKEISELLMN